ncbi:hypothetical protein OAB29_01020 [Oceanospirillaceae bacterium]|nr:hypothetical protein [Oceanospirillaceae bacterium]
MAITAELWQANLIALVSAFVAIKVLRPIATVFILVMVGYLYWVKRRGWGASAKNLNLKDLKQAGSP